MLPQRPRQGLTGRHQVLDRSGGATARLARPRIVCWENAWLDFDYTLNASALAELAWGSIEPTPTGTAEGTLLREAEKKGDLDQ